MKVLLQGAAILAVIYTIINISGRVAVCSAIKSCPLKARLIYTR